MKKTVLSALACCFMGAATLALADVAPNQGITPNQSISQKGSNGKKCSGKHGCHGKHGNKKPSSGTGN